MDVKTLVTDEGFQSIRPRVAVDAMCGDHGPEEVVAGVLGWASEHDDADLILVGDLDRINAAAPSGLPPHVTALPASELVSMDEHPALAVRRKRDASINVAMRLVKDGKADAVVTAGHTGAGVASAILNLGRLPGVDRPALAVQLLPDRRPLVLLDTGAPTASSGPN